MPFDILQKVLNDKTVEMPLHIYHYLWTWKTTSSVGFV